MSFQLPRLSEGFQASGVVTQVRFLTGMGSHMSLEKKNVEYHWYFKRKNYQLDGTLRRLRNLTV